MPRTSEQFKQMRNEREDSILHAGMYLFATRGYESTTVDAISKIANCSHGLVFHYYPTKDELYKAVIDKMVKPIIRRLIVTIDYNQKAKFMFIDSTNKFLAGLKSENDEFAWSIYLLLDMHLQGIIEPKVKNVESKKKVYDWVYEMIERGKEEGDFNDLNSRELVVSILALYKGLAYNRIKVGYKKFLCPSSDVILNMILK